MINLGRNLREIIRHAYDLSEAQGMGHLQYDPDRTEPKNLDVIALDAERIGLLDMDYIEGRSIKLLARRNESGEWILMENYWRDHTHTALDELVLRIGQYQ